MSRAHPKSYKHLTSYLAENGDLILVEKEYAMNAWRLTIDELKALPENIGKQMLRSLWLDASQNRDGRVQYKGMGSFPEIADAIRGHHMKVREICEFYDSREGDDKHTRRNWTNA
jgi:hypothetical protein